MIRSNEKRSLFIDDADREYFLRRMAVKAKETIIDIIAYVLMDNHVHLLIFDEDLNISEFMKKINISYVVYFNKKYNRIGHLLCTSKIQSDSKLRFKWLLEN
jgi:putative transposase